MPNNFQGKTKNPKWTNAETRKHAKSHQRGRLSRFINSLNDTSNAASGPYGSADGETVDSTALEHDGYIIRWKPGTTDTQKLNEQIKGGYLVRESFREDDNNDGQSYEVIEIRGRISEEQLARQLASQRQVASIDKNWVYRTLATVETLPLPSSTMKTKQRITNNPGWTDNNIRRRAKSRPHSRLATFLAAIKESSRSPGSILGGTDEDATQSTDQRYDGYIIRWKPGTTDAQKNSEQIKGGYLVRESFRDNDDDDDDDETNDRTYEAIDTRGRISDEQLARQLASQSQVELIEKNWVYTTQLTINDTYPSNGQQWGLLESPGINAHTFFTSTDWDLYTKGPDVYTVVLDEGAMYTHIDLTGRFGNPGEIGGNTGQDDDGNGYIDDYYGWDFQANDNSIFDSYLDDHGTHVAGIIGATAGNSTGVAGIAPLSKIIHAKFLGTLGGTTADAIEALTYIANLKRNHQVPIIAVNCSWGGGGYSQALYDAIKDLDELGILVICAAGNNGSNIPMYPAAYDLPNVISVGSIGSNGAKSSFSNYGPSVDLFAPGGSIISTVPSTSRRAPTSTYANYSGTSMAAPQVTGMAAVLKQMYPSKTHLEIKDAILNSVTKTSTLQGQADTGGYANLRAAIDALGAGTTSSPNLPTTASTSNSPVDESDNNIITVDFKGAANSSANYVVGGAITIDDFEIDSPPTSGTVNLDANGSAILTWNIKADNLTEGTESFQLFLDNNPTSPALTVEVLDTSVTAGTSNNGANNPIDNELWGTENSDASLIANATQTQASGVTKGGPDTGRGTVDVVTGNTSHSMTYILGDSRGMLYDDGNNRSIGRNDYLRITNLKAYDTLQLSTGSYIYQTNSITQTVTLYRDTTGNGRLDTGRRRTDEMIAQFDGAGAIFSTVNVEYV
jgi:subtilisin family serine protease